MSIKDIKLKKGMSREEVNELIGEWLTLEDEMYSGVKPKHTWRCKCGNVFERTWDSVKHQNATDCGCVRHNEQEERYKHEVEKTGEYEYIRSYRRGDRLPNGKIVGDVTYIQVKHKYCGSIYEIQSSSFIYLRSACQNCCGSYENSFAYHIEQELNEPLEKYWDFEKNTVNPYYINKKTDTFKIWIKCTEKDYHGSYEVSCSNFTKGNRCSYCSSKKVHPLDSFAQYHIDNTDKDFLTKYWSDKNTIDPWSIAPNSSKYSIWIKCYETDYHEDYITDPNSFTSGNRCPYCVNQKVHPKDSFAQYHIDYTDKDFLTKYWSDKNTVDPWSISPVCTTKVWIKCQEHEYHNDFGGYEISCANFTNGKRCSYCRSRNLHPIDSFGGVNLYAVSYWSENNNISPFKVNKSRNKKYKFICPKCGVEFVRLLSSVSRSRNILCDKCNSSIGEIEIYNYLATRNINFTPQKTYEGLVGIRGGNLSYDFYLPEYNLLIEYQGEQHEKFIKGIHGKIDVFYRQQEHDKRKKEYAKENNITLLEIWYWDFDNIEEILKNELNI